MKKIFLSSLIAILFLSNIATARTFPDVGNDEIYKKGIEYLASEGILHGHPDGRFKPKDTINRAEMMKIIAEGAAIYYGWPQTVFDAYENENCFPDVKAGQWYTKYICYGKANGWIVGYQDGRFKPNQTVSFVEGLKISYKGFSLEFIEPQSSWFRDLVNRAGENNFIPHTIAGFHNGLQRNQMADMITRILKMREGASAFEEYLGDRIDIVVTHYSIEKKIDLGRLQKETITP
jgi:hypothetical protein